jgi:hypothetical protein
VVLLDLGVYREVAVGMIAVFPFIEEPAIGPNLGGSQDLLPSPQDDAHRLVVEYHREACHARTPSKTLAAGSTM